MTKCKIIYYLDNEIVDIWRGNYSGSSLYSYCGGREQFKRDVGQMLLGNTKHFDCIELYKRNRAGVKRKLIDKISIGGS